MPQFFRLSGEHNSMSWVRRLWMKEMRIYIINLFLFFSFIANAEAKTHYIVRDGDSLWEIAQKFRVELPHIIQLNPQINNPHLIFPGEIINLSEHRDHDKIIFLTTEENALFEITNAKRNSLGLKPLQIDQELSSAARRKSIDMKAMNYVSHNSPTYGDSTSMLKAFQIPFKTVKENIGAGAGTAREMFSVWMKSSVNQANVLDSKITHIGIGYIEGGHHGHYWTVLFIQKVEGGDSNGKNTRYHD